MNVKLNNSLRKGIFSANKKNFSAKFFLFVLSFYLLILFLPLKEYGQFLALKFKSMNRFVSKIVSVLKRRFVREPLLWGAFFIMLTVSDISMDLGLSASLSAVEVSGMILLFYLNTLVLMPRLLVKHKVLLYLVFSGAILYAAVSQFAYLSEFVIREYDEFAVAEEEQSLLDIQLPSETRPFFEEDDNMSVLEDSLRLKIAVIFVCTYLFSSLLYYVNKANKDEQERLELERKRSQMELRFLRSQINPHFLFNALNNIYSMVYMQDKNAPNSVLMLSEMLRYVTDECKSEKISLEDEVHYLENYINFQKFSYEKFIDVKFDVDVPKEPVYVAPMLLEPFIENGFKHSGIGIENGAYIHIKLMVEDGRLRFEMKNSKGKKKSGSKKRDGVGLLNVEQRLRLLYPDAHKFELEDKEDSFYVKIEFDVVR